MFYDTTLMYVIWRKRKREHASRRGNVGDVRLTPIIAQSRRLNGRPRQEHIVGAGRFSPLGPLGMLNHFLFLATHRTDT
jgi:hypothetical protein